MTEPGAPSPEAASSAGADRVAREVGALSAGLTRVVFGDYSVRLSTAEPDPQFGQLAMLVNVVIASASKAISERDDLVAQLRRRNEELAASRIFLESIVENLPHMIFVKDAEHLRFERLNKAGEELLGLDRRDLIGKSDRDFFPRDQAEAFTAKDRETLARGALVDIAEEPIDTPRGRRWLHTKKIPIRDERGKPAFLLGISEDVTDRREAEERRRGTEEALARSESRLRAIIENIREGVLILDAAGRVSGWNKAAQAMFRDEVDASLGKPAGNLLLAQLQDLHPGYGLSVQARRRDGTRFPVEVSLSEIDAGRERFQVAIVRDLTERREFQQRLDEQVQRMAERTSTLEAIFAATSDGMVLLDTEWRVRFANRRFRELLGQEGALSVGTDASTLAARLAATFAPVPADAFERVLGVAAASGTFPGSGVVRSPLLANLDDRGLAPFRCTVRGGAQAILLSGAPVLSEEGNLLGWLALFRDITNEEAARHAKDELVGNVSHELRTPLTSIKGFVDLLRRGRTGPVTPKQVALLDVVAADVARLERLVGDLLDVDRIGAASLRRERFDLRAVLDEVMDERGRAGEKPSVALVRRYGTAPLPVDADRARLRQVFANLVSNAVKYTPAGTVTLGALVRGREIVVEVVDTGIGIALEDRKRLFGRFFRADDQRVRAESGTGLGLAIVQQIVAAHGGQVEVESTPGCGSTFRIRLECAGDRS